MSVQNRSVNYYPPGPIAADFLASNAFICGIKGPIGSGKSTACVMKVLRHARMQPKNKEGIRKSRYAIIRNCFDDKTEILTEQRGWKLFRELNKEDKVAQLNGDSLEFVKPSCYYEADYIGEMMGFEGEGVDFLVTPDHRTWVSKKHGRNQKYRDYHFALCKNIYGTTSYRMRRDCEWQGAISEYSADIFEWLGFWFAEGHIGVHEEYGHSRKRFNITQCNLDGVEYARELFYRAGVPFNESTNPGGTIFRVSVRRNNHNQLGVILFEQLKNSGLAATKKLPEWIKSAPKEKLTAFIHGYLRGDGHSRKDSVTKTLYTSSYQLADDLQEIALKAGISTNIRSRNRIGTQVVIGDARGVVNAIEYSITLLSPKKNRPKLIKQKGRYKGWYKQNYSGKVYCVEVPTHVVCVRRNGITGFSSQTYPELKTTTIPTWHQWLPKTVGKWVSQGPPTHHILDKNEGIDMEVWFVALDQPDDVAKVLSMELTSAWVNEAREIPKAIIDGLTGRVGRFKPSVDEPDLWPYNPQIIMDTNPSEDDHWWYVLAEQDTSTQEGMDIYESMLEAERELRAEGLLGENDSLYEFYSQPGANEPGAENIQNLIPGYYAKSRAGKGEDWIKVYIDAEYGFVKEGRPVYPEYKDSTHCQEFSLVPGLPIRIGLDFGLQPAAIFAQKTSKGQWRWYSELCGDGIGVYRFAEQIHAHLADHYLGFKVMQITGDPAGDARSSTDKKERTTYQILKALGINATPASSNDMVKRREAVAVPLNRMIDGEPGLIIHPNCRITRRGMAGGYAYKRIRVSGTERYQDKPEKNRYSHPCDAGQYLHLGGGEYKAIIKTKKPIQHIEPWEESVPGLGM